jgi:hypothetical protein
VENGIRLGVRARTRPNRGELEWRTPIRHTITSILRDPIYAGYYRYGRTRMDPRRKKPGRPQTGRVLLPRESCLAAARPTSPRSATRRTSAGSPRTGRGPSPRGTAGRPLTVGGPGLLCPLRPSHDRALRRQGPLPAIHLRVRGCQQVAAPVQYRRPGPG